MQASIYFASSPFLSLPTTKTLSNTIIYPAKHHHQSIQTSPRISSIKAAAASSDAPQAIDYNSMDSSVFPAEACETLGGVACDAEMFPETKPQPKAKDAPTTKQAPVDREYLEYDSPKTVFIAEACDDLGGEFCEPAYQSTDRT